MKSKSRSRSKRSEKASIRLPSDYPWKVLHELTCDLGQFLQDNDKKRIAHITRNRDFDAYLQLSQDWGLQSMTHSDASIAELRAKYQLSALLKKFQFPTDSESRRSAALEKFISAEDVCRQYNLTGYKKLIMGETEFAVELNTYIRGFIQEVIGVELPDYDVMTEWSRHGPGATTSTENGFNSSYNKYESWPYHCTLRARRHVIATIRRDERWLGALEDSYRQRFNIPKTSILDQKCFWTNVIEIVDGNQITTVSKSAVIDRTIAIEPTLNVFLQLGVDGFIRQRLKRFGVNLDSQWKNQRMARVGSSTQDYATLDLAAASDSISLGLCKSVLPSAWYDYLVDLRSPMGSVGGETISYSKISSMGNGYTFALESLIFAAITSAVLKIDLGIRHLHNDAAVYGDDIIVPTECVPHMIEGLDLCGFKLNTDKSFTEGFVRESCGADWYHGMPVRPISMTTLPTSVTGLFVDRNRLQRILNVFYGIEDSKVVSLIDSWIPDKFQKIHGPFSDEDFSSYIHTKRPTNSRYRHGRWCFKRVVVKSEKTIAKVFLFRKLMHNLKHAPHREPWDASTSTGSRFVPTRSNTRLYTLSNSTADFWQDEYHNEPSRF